MTNRFLHVETTRVGNSGFREKFPSASWSNWSHCRERFKWLRHRMCKRSCWRLKGRCWLRAVAMNLTGDSKKYKNSRMLCRLLLARSRVVLLIRKAICMRGRLALMSIIVRLVGSSMARWSVFVSVLVMSALLEINRRGFTSGDLVRSTNLRRKRSMFSKVAPQPSW